MTNVFKIHKKPQIHISLRSVKIIALIWKSFKLFQLSILDLPVYILSQLLHIKGLICRVQVKSINTFLKKDDN